MALFGRPTAEDDRKAREWAEWFAHRNLFAVASLVLGVFSLIEFGALIIFGIAGIGLGIVALVQLARVPAHSEESAQAGGKSGISLAGTKPHSLAYRDNKVSEPVNALDYERPGMRVVPTKGHGLAWSGIGLSAASLVIAGLLYFRVFG